MSDDDFGELLRGLPQPLYYVLDARKRVRATKSVAKWGAFFENFENRRVALTRLVDGGHLSTVFLGLDHRYSGDGPPIVFETMRFYGEGNDSGPDLIDRTTTWAKAELAHLQWCEEHAELVATEAAT